VPGATWPPPAFPPRSDAGFLISKSFTNHGIVILMNDVIVQEGDPVLRRIAEPVPERDFNTPELKAIVDRMFVALDKERDGVAIAAPQLGISLRIFVVRHERLHPEHTPDFEPEIGVYINPKIIKASRRSIPMDEGCLSVRRIYGKVMRHERATVRAQRLDGTVFERGGGGILAEVFQHEIDHLDGILFIDHATDLIEISEEHYERSRNR
jgi:peptide deformylase